MKKFKLIKKIEKLPLTKDQIRIIYEILINESNLLTHTIYSQEYGWHEKITENNYYTHQIN